MAVLAPPTLTRDQTVGSQYQCPDYTPRIQQLKRFRTLDYVSLSVTMACRNIYDRCSRDGLDGKTQQARTPGYGRTLDARPLVDTRGTAILSRKRPPCLYDRSNHGLSAGDEESRTAHEEDQQRPYLRGFA